MLYSSIKTIQIWFVVSDRSWRHQNGIASKVFDWGGRTRYDWTMSSGGVGTCSVSNWVISHNGSSGQIQH